MRLNASTGVGTLLPDASPVKQKSSRVSRPPAPAAAPRLKPPPVALPRAAEDAERPVAENRIIEPLCFSPHAALHERLKALRAERLEIRGRICRAPSRTRTKAWLRARRADCEALTDRIVELERQLAAPPPTPVPGAVIRTVIEVHRPARPGSRGGLSVQVMCNPQFADPHSLENLLIVWLIKEQPLEITVDGRTVHESRGEGWQARGRSTLRIEATVPVGEVFWVVAPPAMSSNPSGDPRLIIPVLAGYGCALSFNGEPLDYPMLNFRPDLVDNDLV